jgi:hypothetical protein
MTPLTQISASDSVGVNFDSGTEFADALCGVRAK